MRLLDRYILKSFLLPFFYCFLSIAAIWLILDMGDKLPTLIDAHASIREILRFYQIQLPNIVVFCLPIALLLATLYSLSRLSRTNEIVSMVTTGISIARLLVPMFFVGLLATGLMLWLNYQLAPESEVRRKEYFDQITVGKKKSKDLTAVLFRNREEHRTWFFERLPKDGLEARGLQILQQNEHGDAVWKVFAKNARYDPATKVWTLTNGEYLELAPDGKIVRQKNFDSRLFPDFSETPLRMATVDVQAENLGVPALKQYLTMNRDLPKAQKAPFETHLFYRWALPWTCLVVMFLGGALGIAFSRRGVMKGVVWTLGLFFAMIFARGLSLSLGQGGRIEPIYASWVPLVGFMILGLILLWKRSSGSNLLLFRSRR